MIDDRHAGKACGGNRKRKQAQETGAFPAIERKQVMTYAMAKGGIMKRLGLVLVILICAVAFLAAPALAKKPKAMKIGHEMSPRASGTPGSG